MTVGRVRLLTLVQGFRGYLEYLCAFSGFSCGRELRFDVGSLVSWAVPTWLGRPSALLYPLGVRTEDFQGCNCCKVLSGIQGGSESKDNHLGETQRDPEHHWKSTVT